MTLTCVRDRTYSQVRVVYSTGFGLVQCSSSNREGGNNLWQQATVVILVGEGKGGQICMSEVGPVIWRQGRAIGVNFGREEGKATTTVVGR